MCRTTMAMATATSMWCWRLHQFQQQQLLLETTIGIDSNDTAVWNEKLTIIKRGFDAKRNVDVSCDSRLWPDSGHKDVRCCVAMRYQWSILKHTCSHYYHFINTEKWYTTTSTIATTTITATHAIYEHKISVAKDHYIALRYYGVTVI